MFRAKHNDAGQTGTTGSNQLAEIQIMGQKHPVLFPGFGQNRLVFETLKTLFVEVDSIISQAAEEVYRFRRDSHIGKKLHAEPGSNA